MRERASGFEKTKNLERARGNEVWQDLSYLFFYGKLKLLDYAEAFNSAIIFHSFAFSVGLDVQRIVRKFARNYDYAAENYPAESNLQELQRDMQQ